MRDVTNAIHDDAPTVPESEVQQQITLNSTLAAFARLLPRSVRSDDWQEQPT